MKELRVVNNFGPLLITQSLTEGSQCFALLIAPKSAPLTGVRRNLDAGNLRAEAFGLAPARVHVQPDGEFGVRRQLRQVAAKRFDAFELRVVFFLVNGGGGHFFRGRAAFLQRARGQQFLQQGIEAEFAVEGHERSGIRLTHLQFVEIELQRYAGINRGQLLAHQHLLFLLPQRFAVPLVRNLFSVLKRVFNGAIFLDELGGTLFADSLGTWNVVDRVAEQRHQVDHSCRRNAQDFLDLFRVDDGVSLGAARTGAKNAHPGIDQLHHVLVVRNDEDDEVLFGGLLGDCTNDVISFEAVEFQNRQTHGLAKATHIRQLHAHLVGHRWALRLISFKELVAKGGFAGVENDADVFRLVVLDQTTNNVGEKKRHFRGNSARRIHAHHGGVERTVDVRHGIHEKQFFGSFCLAGHLGSITNEDPRAASRAHVIDREGRAMRRTRVNIQATPSYFLTTARL